MKRGISADRDACSHPPAISDSSALRLSVVSSTGQPIQDREFFSEEVDYIMAAVSNLGLSTLVFLLLKGWRPKVR